MACATAATSRAAVLAAGGAQQMRRMTSGEIRFSAGIDKSWARVSTANRAWVRGAYFSGNLSRHNLIGGKVSAPDFIGGH